MARAPLAVSPVRRALTIVAVLVVLGVVVAAGTLLRTQQPDARQVVTVAAGQADAVCPVGTVRAVGASPSASPSPGSVPSASGVPSASDPGLPVTPAPSATPSPVPSASPALPSTSPTPSTGTAPAAPGSSPSASPSSGLPGLTPGASPSPGVPGAPSSGVPVPGATPSTVTPSTAPTLAPLPSATASAVAGRVTVVASGATDAGTDPPTGRVTLGLLGQDDAGVSVDRQGRGATLDQAAAPVLLRADGTLAPTAVGAVVSRSVDGPEAGLEAAPCVVPSTSAWLPGVASGASDRTELALSNPDDAEATVDLAFYGRNGRVAVPGSPGVEIPAGSSRSVSLSGLVDAEGPLTVAVQATTGAGRRRRAADPYVGRHPGRRGLGRPRQRPRHPARRPGRPR